jgi:L-malate glycosyltransferase
VLQVIDSLRIGGAQKLMLTFARQAREQNIDLTVVSLSEFNEGMTLAKPLEKMGVKVFLFPADKLFSLSRLRAFTRFVKEGKFSVIHAHLTYANIIAGIVGKLIKTPVLSTLHSTAVDKRHAHFLRDKIELEMLRRAKRILGVGKSVSDIYEDILKRDVITLPNAVDENSPLSADENDALRTQIGLDTAQVIFISVGRLSPDKGVDDLLQAFTLIHKEKENVALLIVGDGDLRDELKGLAKKLGLEKVVFWLGIRNDVPKLLAISDIYISGSRREGLPLSLLEAMMSALPMAVTDVGEVAKLVNNDAGILVPHSKPKKLAKAALDILAMPNYGKTLGEAGLARAQKEYGAEQWFMRTLNIYEEITNIAQEQAH